MNGEYRFRLVDPANAQADEISLVCLDDEAALLLAERFAQHDSVEVWTADRFVGRIPPLAAAGAPAASAPAGDPPAAPKRFKPFWSGAWRRGAARKTAPS